MFWLWIKFVSGGAAILGSLVGGAGGIALARYDVQKRKHPRKSFLLRVPFYTLAGTVLGTLGGGGWWISIPLGLFLYDRTLEQKGK